MISNAHAIILAYYFETINETKQRKQIHVLHNEVATTNSDVNLTHTHRLKLVSPHPRNKQNMCMQISKLSKYK